MANVDLAELARTMTAIKEAVEAIAADMGIKLGESNPVVIESNNEVVLETSQYGGVKLARVEALKKRLRESNDPLEKEFAAAIGDFHFVFDQPGTNDFQKLHVTANISDFTMLSASQATSEENRMFAGPSSTWTERPNYWGRGKHSVKVNALPDHTTWAEGLNPKLATNTNMVYPRLLAALDKLKKDGFWQVMKFGPQFKY